MAIVRRVDPQAVGEYLLKRRRRAKRASFAALADQIPWRDMPRLPYDESMATITANTYRLEIEARAAAGDPAGVAMLAKLNGEEVGDDPSGD